MAIIPNLFVDISTDDGAVTIMWHQLETLTDGELEHLRISREQLRWVFDERRSKKICQQQVEFLVPIRRWTVNGTSN